MTTTAATKQTYWEDVKEGQEVPGYDLPLTETQVVLQVSGSQDWYVVHHDREYAHNAGHPDIFMNTRFTRGCMNRMLTDWMGPQGWLQRLRIEMRRMNRPGDVMKMRGVVSKKAVRDGKNTVDIECWIENDREGKTTICEATVLLPTKGQDKAVAVS